MILCEKDNASLAEYDWKLFQVHFLAQAEPKSLSR